MAVAKIDDILAQMKRNPKNVRFTDLCKVCENFFGEPRKGASSHLISELLTSRNFKCNLFGLKDQRHSGAGVDITLLIHDFA